MDKSTKTHPKDLYPLGTILKKPKSKLGDSYYHTAENHSHRYSGYWEKKDCHLITQFVRVSSDIRSGDYFNADEVVPVDNTLQPLQHHKPFLNLIQPTQRKLTKQDLIELVSIGMLMDTSGNKIPKQDIDIVFVGKFKQLATEAVEEYLKNK